MADTNNDNDERSVRSSTPPLNPDKILEMDALEELLRAESIQHIDAAWRAQRRMLRSCLQPDDAEGDAKRTGHVQHDQGKEEVMNEVKPSKRSIEGEGTDGRVEKIARIVPNTAADFER